MTFILGSFSANARDVGARGWTQGIEPNCVVGPEVGRLALQIARFTRLITDGPRAGCRQCQCQFRRRCRRRCSCSYWLRYQRWCSLLWTHLALSLLAASICGLSIDTHAPSDAGPSERFARKRIPWLCLCLALVCPKPVVMCVHSAPISV